MTLKDLLKKKDKIKDEAPAPPSGPLLSPDVPEFTFMRTTTTTQEVISPPSFPGDPVRDQKLSPNYPSSSLSPEQPHKRFSRLRRHSNAAAQPTASGHSKSGSSGRLNFGRSRSSSSVNVPENLPNVGSELARTEEDEARWEKRATVMVQGAPLSRDASGPTTPIIEATPTGRKRSVSVAQPGSDANIQEAIRLHEAGRLTESTQMFGRLANPDGPNNPLSQVLYGLALRHGWGIDRDPARAVQYLQKAAANSAEIESLALNAGLKKGGDAKGELVLAMYELANSYRNGWGIKKDPVAAREYYETAANLGDTDAMNEVAWCYLEGFGCKKDKFKAAQFLRRAEEKGNKTLGNTWIWKDKYNPK